MLVIDGAGRTRSVARSRECLRRLSIATWRIAAPADAVMTGQEYNAVWLKLSGEGRLKQRKNDSCTTTNRSMEADENTRSTRTEPFPFLVSDLFPEVQPFGHSSSHPLPIEAMALFMRRSW